MRHELAPGASGRQAGWGLRLSNALLTLAVTVFFFASGASGLIYQVAWVRILSLIFGVTVYAVSTVLAGFMAGLALGSFLSGRFADRIRNPLRVYGAIERTVPLPDGADADAAKAAFNNGVLTIVMPKSAEAQAETKRIPVQAG